MVRKLSVDKNGLRKGAWSEEEDAKLRAYIERYGHWNWRQLPRFAGLSRCGKSCRLRWLNYLRPGLKKGKYSQQEEELIIKLHEELGNKWSAIAERLRGRTDNEIKNYWHTHLKKQMKQDPKSSKSTKQTSGRSQHMSVPKQNQQVMFTSESTPNGESKQDVAAASDAFLDLSSTNYNSIPLGRQELDTEDSVSSVESFAQTFQMLWTEPFSLDTSYNQISSSTSCNSTLSDWVTEDSISSGDSFAEPFESFWTEPFSLDMSYNQTSLQSPLMEEGFELPFASFPDDGIDLFQ